MREWFANVYPKWLVNGEPYSSRGEKCASAAEADRSRDKRRPAFRIHVRLKPEGAPRRYASEFERKMWELEVLDYKQWSIANEVKASPRTPKTEESAS